MRDLAFPVEKTVADTEYYSKRVAKKPRVHFRQRNPLSAWEEELPTTVGSQESDAPWTAMPGMPKMSPPPPPTSTSRPPALPPLPRAQKAFSDLPLKSASPRVFAFGTHAPPVADAIKMMRAPSTSNVLGGAHVTNSASAFKEAWLDTGILLLAMVSTLIFMSVLQGSRVPAAALLLLPLGVSAVQSVWPARKTSRHTWLVPLTASVGIVLLAHGDWRHIVLLYACLATAAVVHRLRP